AGRRRWHDQRGGVERSGATPAPRTAGITPARSGRQTRKPPRRAAPDRGAAARLDGAVGRTGHAFARLSLRSPLAPCPLPRLFLLPPGEGGAKRRMRVRVCVCSIWPQTARPGPSPALTGTLSRRERG